MTPEEFFELYKQAFPQIQVYRENLPYTVILQTAVTRKTYRDEHPEVLTKPISLNRITSK